MNESTDRRETTHTVRQHSVARFFLVPYHIGWHLAHHVDAGIPWRNLPRYHRLLVERATSPLSSSTRSYTAIWRTLASRPR